MSSLLTFIQQLYPTLGWTTEFMQWQYFENPAGEAKTWICFDGEKPVGSVTALPHVVWTHDRKTIGYRIQDVMTDPDYRGRSIYRKLSENCYAFLDSEEKAVHFTFPNENSDRVFRTSGWTPVGNIPLWTATPSKNTGDDVLPEGCCLLGTFSTPDEDVWASWRRVEYLGIDKNVAYLNWKYFGNPRAEYECYRLDRAETSAIYILKKYNLNTGNTQIHLCDLFYSQYCEDVLNDVLAFVHNRAVVEKASAITTWIAPTDELAALISAMGFSYSPVETRSYFLRSSNTSTQDYFSTWNIKMGDSDVY